MGEKKKRCRDGSHGSSEGGGGIYKGARRKEG
jgi:hypothetical protein